MVMWLFEQYLTELSKTAVTEQVKLSNFASVYHEGALKSYSTYRPLPPEALCCG